MTNCKKLLAGLLTAALLTAAIPTAFAAEVTFTDVPAESEYAAAVAYVAEKGYMQGYGNGIFGVDDPVTFGQLDLILKRFRGEDAQWAGEVDATVTSLTRGQLAQLLEQARQDGDTLRIAQQGIFSAGGTVVTSDGTFDVANYYTSRDGSTSHVDHANVLYQIPEDDTGLPMVFLHGYGQSRVGWMTTPDGREGWSDLFLRKGHSVWLIDQPRRGEAGQTSMAGTISTDPSDQTWYTQFRIGTYLDGAFTYNEGSQFPTGEDALDQFFRQMTPDTAMDSANGDQNIDMTVVAQAVAAAIDEVYARTGKDSILVTHSQGGMPGWETARYTDHIAAIVAIEPGMAPVVDGEDYAAMLEKNIPVAFYYGDYIGPEFSDVPAAGMWGMMASSADAFTAAYTAAGGISTVVHLPDEGITGNDHFMFQDLNNDVIADHVEAWIEANVK